MSIKFTRIKKCLELDDKLAFGAHSGKSISYMLEFEPEYLFWATKQPNLIFLCHTAAIRLEEKATRAKQEKEKHKAKAYYYADTDQDSWFDDVPF
jgi:hypothetical protein